MLNTVTRAVILVASLPENLDVQEKHIEGICYLPLRSQAAFNAATWNHGTFDTKILVADKAVRGLLSDVRDPSRPTQPFGRMVKD